MRLLSWLAVAGLCSLAASSQASAEGSNGVAHSVPGQLDRSFGQNGVRINKGWDAFNPFIVERLPSGKFIVGDDDGLIRLNSDGSLDESYGYLGMSDSAVMLRRTEWITDINLVDDGAIVTFATGANGPSFEVAKWKKDGYFDKSFANRGRYFGGRRGTYLDATSTSVRPDGRIYVAGGKNPLGGPKSYGRLILLNANGTLNKGFGKRGAFRLPAPARGSRSLTDFTDVHATPDGGAIVSGIIGPHFVVLKVNRNGRLDKNFGDHAGITRVRVDNNDNTLHRTAITSYTDQKLVFSDCGKRMYALAGMDRMHQKIVAFNRNGERLWNFGVDGSIALPNPRSHLLGNLVAVGSKYLLLTGSSSRRDDEGKWRQDSSMVLFNQAGKRVKRFGVDGFRVPAAPKMASIIDTVSDPAGNLYAFGDDRIRVVPSEDPDFAIAKFKPVGWTK